MKFLVQAANDMYIYLTRLSDFTIIIWKSVDFSLLQNGLELSNDLSFWKRMRLFFFICVLKTSILPLSTILIFDSGIVLSVFGFCFSFDIYYNVYLAVKDYILYVQSFIVFKKMSVSQQKYLTMNTKYR